MQTFTLVPEYSFVNDENFKTQQTPSEFGYVQTRAYWPIPKRTFQLHWDAATQAEKEYALSFFRDHVGPAGSFLYQPVDPIPAPHRAGDPAESSAGSLLLRTYYFAIAWKTAEGVTTISPVESFEVAANKVFNLTVPKFWYRSITHANIYVGTADDDLELQTTFSVSGGTWVEPSGGLVSGDPPEETNGALETPTVHLLADTFTVAKRSPVSWGMDMSFEEIIT